MLGSAALVTAAGGPAAATYGFAVVATVAMTLYRPAHSALLPRLGEVSSRAGQRECGSRHVDSLATLGGPLVAAVLLATADRPRSSPLARCVAVGRSGGRRALVRRAAASGDRAWERPRDAPGLHHDRGRSQAPADHRARGGQTFTRGCLTVFAVVVAIDLLDLEIRCRCPECGRRPGRTRPRSSHSGWPGVADSPAGSASASRCSARRWS